MQRCTVCKKDAVYSRYYSGQKLCRQCFIKSIEGQVQRTISKYNMFKHDNRIAVAVSGGKDSIVLLHILWKIEKKFPQAELVAVTIDEGIDGYRFEAVKLARENCKKLGVEHLVILFKDLYNYELDDIVEVARTKEGLEPCSYCGVLRRKALNVAAREVKADKLATAHNLDDEVQTMLINIIHGDIMRVARVEPVLEEKHPKFIQRVKPLCEVPEKEVALYAFLKKIKFQTVPCPYISTSLRNDVRTVLNRLETKHPGTKFTIFRAFEKIRPILKEAVSQAKISECRICGEPAVGDVCRPCQSLMTIDLLKA